MLQFIVEDGTGVEGATSGISEDDFDDYVTFKAATVPDGANIQAGLVRGTAWIEGRYGHRFSGVRKNGREQGLSFPRVDAVYRDGSDVPEDTVPIEYKVAVAEATLRELTSAGSLSPDIIPITTSGGAVKRLSVQVGTLKKETEYTEGGTTGVSIPRFPTIDAAIWPLLEQVSSGGGMVPLLRA